MLMVLLGPVKRRQRYHFGHHRFAENVLIVEFFDIGFGDRFLIVADVEDRGTVLRAVSLC